MKDELKIEKKNWKLTNTRINRRINKLRARDGLKFVEVTHHPPTGSVGRYVVYLPLNCCLGFQGSKRRMIFVGEKYKERQIESPTRFLSLPQQILTKKTKAPLSRERWEIKPFGQHHQRRDAWDTTPKSKRHFGPWCPAVEARRAHFRLVFPTTMNLLANAFFFIIESNTMQKGPARRRGEMKRRESKLMAVRNCLTKFVPGATRRNHRRFIGH